MAWTVVPNLDEARDQLNERFPGRDTRSDGSIGDTAHQRYPSSHNPDRTGRPEYRDGDQLDEVRARDFDADLRDPHGVTMEQVVQLWVTLARAGVLWWVRYIIFNGRIWHRRHGFATHAYTGSNRHTGHCHVTSEFTQAADTVRGTDWRLDQLGTPAPVPPRPAPGPPVAFPLPAGHYFGPRRDGNRSVSGYYRRRFRSKTDRQWLTAWTRQLVRRGWPAGKGRRYLRKAGSDGRYGPEYRELIKAFQADQGLTRDGLLGRKTWDAAYRNPIR
ncbi:peptidoglycan-binding protein [Salinispora arenicola]|uniref:peptidoglycan-binding domain-containing protein n=1 Tax=Salinispora arenicola TaxID=168697 RepID=UPI00169DCAEE|nr:peptidoglycan-binding domain-containing protein [Salinispora arenicola]NIL57090.1 peptidoglycan-binding protein [Salinispora arenicola]